MTLPRDKNTRDKKMMTRRPDSTSTVHRRTVVAAALAGVATLWSSASAWARDRVGRRHGSSRRSDPLATPSANRAVQAEKSAPQPSEPEPPIWLGHL